MKKILILAIYPAPYRKEVFDRFKNHFETDVFFENSKGDERSSEWFSKGDFYLLDTEIGKAIYKKSLSQIHQYDLIAVYDYTTKEGMKLILRAKMAHIPYVINADGMMMASHGNMLREIVKRFLISGVSACLASGKNAEDYFIKYGAKKDLIYHHTFSTLNSDEILDEPIGENERKELREKLNLPHDKKIAIAVGRFIPLKRYLELIQAWKEMPSEYILLLIGGGEEETNYRKYIRDNDLCNVVIEGFHPKDELFEYYKAADVFVHPTSYDVWGLVVNEAMACGLPVVVSDHCVAGLELIKNDKNGFLVEMGNDSYMCEKVDQILKDNLLRYNMSKNVIQTIEPYTLEHMAQTHIQVFKEILNVQ